jgi:hypothetical protein
VQSARPSVPRSNDRTNGCAQVWEDGPAFLELVRRGAALQRQKEEIEAARKVGRARVLVSLVWPHDVCSVATALRNAVVQGCLKGAWAVPKGAFLQTVAGAEAAAAPAPKGGSGGSGGGGGGTRQPGPK